MKGPGAVRPIKLAVQAELDDGASYERAMPMSPRATYGWTTPLAKAPAL